MTFQYVLHIEFDFSSTVLFLERPFCGSFFITSREYVSQIAPTPLPLYPYPRLSPQTLPYRTLCVLRAFGNGWKCFVCWFTDQDNAIFDTTSRMTPELRMPEEFGTLLHSHSFFREVSFLGQKDGGNVSFRLTFLVGQSKKHANRFHSSLDLFIMVCSNHLSSIY